MIAHAEPIKRLRAERQKRFANVKAGKFFPLKDHDTTARRASRAAAVLPAGPPPMMATS